MSCLCRSDRHFTTRHFFVDTPVNSVTLITQNLWPATQIIDNARLQILRNLQIPAANPPVPPAPNGPVIAKVVSWHPVDHGGEPRLISARRCSAAPEALDTSARSITWCPNYVAAQAVLISKSVARTGIRISVSIEFSIETAIDANADYPAICCARSVGELTLASDRLSGITIRWVTTVSASARMLLCPAETKASMWSARSVR